MPVTGPYAQDAEVKAGNRVPTLIAEGVVIEGNLYCEGDLHLEGAITGNVVAQRVVVAQGGQINGSVKADAARISGVVAGPIVGCLIEVSEGARILGDVTYYDLMIAPGAQLEGFCRRVSNDARAAGVHVHIENRADDK